MGEQTVIIAGCTKTNATTYATNAAGISLSKVATEHPPRAYNVQITDAIIPS